MTGNRATTYEAGPKPFNFLISPHVMPLGHPIGADPEHFHLIAPYTRDARQWTKLRWTDIYSSETFTVTTGNQGLSQGTARVQSYGDVIARYRTHPEPKSLESDGLPCGRLTIGLLRRRPVVLGELVHIGKETNRLEEVEQGLVHDWDEVQLVFREPQEGTRSKVAVPPWASCRTCGIPVSGMRTKYCSAACKQRAYCRRLLLFRRPDAAAAADA